MPDRPPIVPWHAVWLVIGWLGASTLHANEDLSRRLPATGQFRVVLADGTILAGNRLTNWIPDSPRVDLDGQPLPTIGTESCTIVRAANPPPECPPPFLETWTGDRLSGRVVGYVDTSQTAFSAEPSHLLVERTRPELTRQGQNTVMIRVLPDHVRRIVWSTTDGPSPPGTLYDQREHRFSMRAIRWREDSISILTDNGRRTVGWDQVSEMHLPHVNPWPMLLDEQAVLCPQATHPLVLIQTSAGDLVTSSWQRLRNMPLERPTESAHWHQGIQPIWSLDTLWLPVRTIVRWHFVQPGRVSLSRVQPSRVIQRSPLAQLGRRWQRDRNVDGGNLACDGRLFANGFGVHATNVLQFPIPGLPFGLKTQFGLDQISGNGGCVRGSLQLVSEGDNNQRLATSPLVVGSKTITTLSASVHPDASLDQHLALVVDDAHDERPVGADPWDIRDAGDWLDPMVTFDPSLLSNTAPGRIAAHIPAWRQWNVKFPHDEPIQFSHTWDEIYGPDPAFRLAVNVAGHEPLRLEHRLPAETKARWLVLGVSRNLDGPTSPSIRIHANGRPIGSFTIPLLDRDHVQLQPLVAKLPATDGEQPTTTAIYIEQFSNSTSTPVQWHSISFAADHPTRLTVCDEGHECRLLGPTKDQSIRFCDLDANSGKRSLLLPQSSEVRFGFERPVIIQERPQWGEYRYLRFAFRKRGGGRIGMRLIAANDDPLSPSYDAGKGSPVFNNAFRVSDKDLPDRWIVITRDLVRDFRPLQLDGISIHVQDGIEARFDSIQFARTLRDLK